MAPRNGSGYSYCPTCLSVEQNLHFLSDSLSNLTVDLGIFPKNACKLSICRTCISFLRKTSEFRKTALAVQQIMANLPMGISPTELLRKKCEPGRKFLMGTKGKMASLRSSLPTASLRLLPTPQSSSRPPSLSSPMSLSPSSSPEPPSSPETTYTRPFPPLHPLLPALNIKVSQNDVPKLTETQKPVYIFVNKSKHTDNTGPPNLLKSGPSKTANLITNKQNETAISNTNETKLSVTRSNNGKLKLEKEMKTVTFLRHDNENVNSRVNANVTRKNKSNETITISDSETDDFEVNSSDKSEYRSEFELGSNVLNLVSDENSCGTPEYLSECENDEELYFGNEVSNNFEPPKTTKSTNQGFEQHNIVITGNTFEKEVDNMIDNVASDNTIEQRVQQRNVIDDIRLKNINVSTSIDENTDQSNDVQSSKSRKTITISARKLRSHNRTKKQKKTNAMVRLSDEILPKTDDVCAKNKIEKQLIVQIKPITIPTSNSNIIIKNNLDKNTDNNGLHQGVQDVTTNLLSHVENTTHKKSLLNEIIMKDKCETKDKSGSDMATSNILLLDGNGGKIIKKNTCETESNSIITVDSDYNNKEDLGIETNETEDGSNVESGILNVLNPNDYNKNENIVKQSTETQNKSNLNDGTANVLNQTEFISENYPKEIVETEDNSCLEIRTLSIVNRKNKTIETEVKSNTKSETLNDLNQNKYDSNNLVKYPTKIHDNNIESDTINVMNKCDYEVIAKGTIDTENDSRNHRTLNIRPQNEYNNEIIANAINETKNIVTGESGNSDILKNDWNNETIPEDTTKTENRINVKSNSLNVPNQFDYNNETVTKETIKADSTSTSNTTTNILRRNDNNNDFEIEDNSIDSETVEVLPQINEIIESEGKINIKSGDLKVWNEKDPDTGTNRKAMSETQYNNRTDNKTLNKLQQNNEANRQHVHETEYISVESGSFKVSQQNDDNNDIISKITPEAEDNLIASDIIKVLQKNEHNTEIVIQEINKTQNNSNCKNDTLKILQQSKEGDRTIAKDMSETQYNNRTDNKTLNKLQQNDEDNRQDVHETENISVEIGSFKVSQQNDDDDNDIVSKTTPEAEDNLIVSDIIKVLQKNEHNTEIVIQEINKTQNNSYCKNDTLKILQQSKEGDRTIAKDMSETQYNNRTDNKTLNKLQPNYETNRQDIPETEDISVEIGSFKVSQQNDVSNDIISKITPEAEDKLTIESDIIKVLRKNENNTEIAIKEINETQNKSSLENETLNVFQQSKESDETIAKEVSETQYNNITDYKKLIKLQQNDEANRQNVHEPNISVESRNFKVSQQKDVNNDIISKTTPEAEDKLAVDSDIFKVLRKNENSTEIVIKEINETQNNSSSENETLNILKQNIEGDAAFKISIHEIEENNRARNEILKDLQESEYNNVTIANEITETKINGSTTGVAVLTILQLKENENGTIRTETRDANDNNGIKNDAVKVLQENGKGNELITKDLCESKNNESETLNLLKANEDNRDAITSHQIQVQDKITTEQIVPEIVLLKKPEQRIENEQVERDENEERNSLIQGKRNVIQDNLQNYKRDNDSILHDVQAQEENPKKFRTNSDSHIKSLNFEVARIEVPQKTEAEISGNDLHKTNTKMQLVVNKVTSDSYLKSVVMPSDWTASSKLSTRRKIVPILPYFAIPATVTPVTNKKRLLRKPSVSKLQSLISVCLDHDYTSLNPVFDKESVFEKLRHDILLKALEQSTKRANRKKRKRTRNVKRKSRSRQRQSIQVVSATRLEENVNVNEIKDINMSVSINLSDFFSDAPVHNDHTTNVELEYNAEESIRSSDYTNPYAPVHYDSTSNVELDYNAEESIRSSDYTNPYAPVHNEITTNVEWEYNADESVRSSDYTDQCVMEQEEIHIKQEPVDYDSERTNSAQSDYNYGNDVETNRADVNNITQNSLYDGLLPINENLPIGVEDIKKENSNDGYIDTLQSNLIEPESLNEVNYNPPDTFERGVNQEISLIQRNRFIEFKKAHNNFVDRLITTDNSLLKPIYFANYVEENKDKTNTSKSKNINNCDSFTTNISTKRKRNSSEDIYNFETSDESYSANSSTLIYRPKKIKNNRSLLKKNIKEEIITPSSLIESEINVNSKCDSELKKKDNQDSINQMQRCINEDKPSQSLAFEENDDLNENTKETELNKIGLTDFINNYDEVTLNELSDDEVLINLVTNKTLQANLNPKHIVTNTDKKHFVSKTTSELKKVNMCKNPKKVTQESQLKRSLRSNKLLLKPIVVLEKIDPSTKTIYSTENMNHDIIGYNVKNNKKDTKERYNRKSEASNTRQRGSRSTGNRIKKKRKRRNKESIRTRKHNMKSELESERARIAPIDFIKNNKIITLEELGEEFSNISIEEKEDIVSNTDNVKIHFQDSVHETPGKESNKEFNDYFGENNQETNLYIERNINRAELLIVRENAMHDEFFVNAKYNCSQCVRVFDKGTQKYLHMKRHYPPRKAQELLRCGICDVWYSNNKIIRKHYDTHKNTHKRCLQCRWCERRFLFPNAVTNHIMREHPEMYILYAMHTDSSIDCHKRYPQQSLLQSNIYQVGTKQNTITDTNKLSPEKFSSSLTITLPSETDPFSFLNNSPKNNSAINNSAINNSPIYNLPINSSAEHSDILVEHITITENLSNNTIAENTENIKSANNFDNDSNTENDWSCFTQNNSASDKKKKDELVFEEYGISKEEQGLNSGETLTSPGNLDANNQNKNATFICFVCNEQFETYETLLDHQSLKYNFIKLRQSRHKTGFQCVLCANSYHTFYNLFLHQISHKDYISKVPETEATPADESRISKRKKALYSCFICRNRYVSFNLLLTHQNESHYEYRNVINCSFDTLPVSEENLPKSENCKLKACQTSDVNNQPTTGIDDNLTDNIPIKDIVIENQSAMKDTPTGNNSTTTDKNLAIMEQDIATTMNDTSVENKETAKDLQSQNRNFAAETKEVGISSEDNIVSPKNHSITKEYLCFLCDKRYASFYTLLSHQKFRHIFSQIL